MKSTTFADRVDNYNNVVKPKYSDNPNKANTQTFEHFLMDKHAETYIGTDDDMVESFETWLSDLDADTWIILGQLFAVSHTINYLKQNKY